MGCRLVFHLNPKSLTVTDELNPSVQIGAQCGDSAQILQHLPGGKAALVASLH
jgi:hypothetical protein